MQTEAWQHAFKIGDRVFPDGTVQGFRGSGRNLRIVIKWDDGDEGEYIPTDIRRA